MPSTTPEQELLDSFFFGRLNYEKQLPTAYGHRHFRLRPITALLELAGNPHRAMAIVHVTGTKGKGSVSTMVHHILSQGGYRSGLYTSPHLHHLRERFVVDGREAEVPDLVDAVRSLMPLVAQVDERSAAEPDFGSLTFFDLCTATAFLYFYRQAVQVAVIEVGMGGRLDSTNVVDPLVSIITNVSLDHTQQLGNTVAEIAREKAGIIKPGRPIISGVRQSDAGAIVEEIARRQRAPLAQFGKHLSWTAEDPVAGPCVVRFEDPETHQVIESPTLHTPLLGAHQRDNLALAFAATVYLRTTGWEVSSQAIQAGLIKTRPPGRLQLIRKTPRIILDVAHNPASFEALVRTLQDLDRTAVEGTPSAQQPGRQRILVFAVSRDKDSTEMLRLASKYFDRFLLTRFHNNPRAVELDRLTEIMASVTDPLRPQQVETYERPDEAFQRAVKVADPTDTIVVAGSLFLLAEIGSWTEEIRDVE
ncbi:MAG: bifunctional folylpolyglutamate synthase/dihydrofolate synthase [Planctomycetaceae bacterium]|nr:bifunctional folylpolyglutamate synthase/dihydrofolate synthase [Planctomycetaceae bacterium]